MNIKKPRRLKKLDNEEWRELPKSNGQYFVSNYGRVKSYAYDKKNGRILKANLQNGLYLINLNGKERYPRNIHKLVAEVWLPRPSEAYNFVIHKDFNTLNNHIENLQWVTREEYLEHSSRLMKARYEQLRDKHRVLNSKLKESDVRQLKIMLSKGITQSVIAKMFRISEMQVTRIKRGENWGHITI